MNSHNVAQEANASLRTNILIYCAIVAAVISLAAVRLSLSPFLEIDEAQFFGNIDLRLAYGNSHPPLYNWLVRGALELSDWNWPLAVTMVKGTILILTYALIYEAASQLGGPKASLVALGLTATMPYAVWFVSHNLAHSALLMLGAVGVVHAVIHVVKNDTIAAHIWLGFAAAIGMLAKYNMPILLVALAISIVIVPPVRAAFSSSRALLGPAVFATLTAAPLIAAIAAPDETKQRLSKLYRDGPFSIVDVPGIGVDGALSVMLAVVSFAGIALAIIVLSRRKASPPIAATEKLEGLVKVLWLTVAIGTVAFAAIALLADFKQVQDRYLFPILMPIPIVGSLVVVRSPLRRIVYGVAAAAPFLVIAGILLMVKVDKHRFSRPYAEIAAQLSPLLDQTAEVGLVADGNHALAVNMALALHHDGRSAHVLYDPRASAPDVVVALKRGRVAANRPAGLSTEWCETETIEGEAPMKNWAGSAMIVTATVWRLDPQRTLSAASSSSISPSITESPVCQNAGSRASSPKGSNKAL